MLSPNMEQFGVSMNGMQKAYEKKKSTTMWTGNQHAIVDNVETACRIEILWLW